MDSAAISVASGLTALGLAPGFPRILASASRLSELIDQLASRVGRLPNIVTRVHLAIASSAANDEFGAHGIDEELVGGPPWIDLEARELPTLDEIIEIDGYLVVHEQEHLAGLNQGDHFALSF